MGTPNYQLKKTFFPRNILTGASEADTQWSWLVTFSAFVAYSITTGCYMGTTGVFFSAFLDEFQANHSVTAVVSSLTNFVFMGCGVISGYLVNRWGCRPVVTLGSLCMGLAFVSTSYSPSIILIYFTQGFLKGFAIILMLQPIFVIVSDYHVKRRALALSIVSSGSGVGTAFFASLSEWLISFLGWRWACRVLGFIFGISGTLAAMTFVPIDLNHPNAPKRSRRLTLIELLKLRAFRYLMFSLALYGCYLTAQATFITNFAESRNISSTKAAMLWTYWGIASAAGRLYGGIFKSDPVTRIRDFSLAVLGMGFTGWLLAFNAEEYPNYTIFVVSQIANGWLMGMLYHLASLCIADVFGTENVSLGMGLFFTIQMPAGVSGPPILGFVTDEENGNYTLAFQILAVVQSISGILILWFWKHGRLMIKRRVLTMALEKNEQETFSPIERL